MNPAIAVEHTKGWVHTTVGELCDRHGGEAQTGPFGSQLHAVDYQAEGGIPVIMPVDIRDRRIDTVRIARIGDRKKSELARHRVREGDVLFARRGDVGRFAVISEPESGWICGTGCLRVRLNAPDVHSAFLVHYFGRSEIKEWLLREAKGTTMPNLNTSILRKLPLVLPPLAEQRWIAAILDQAEALRAKRHHALAKLDTLTQSLFLDLFGDPATNLKGWPTTRLGEIGNAQGGLQLSASRSHLPREVPYLRVANVYRDALDLREIKTFRATDAEVARTLLVVDDLLIVEGHGNPEEIGRCALWDGSITECSHQNHLIRVRLDRGQVQPVFVSRYLNSAGGSRLAPCWQDDVRLEHHQCVQRA